MREQNVLPAIRFLTCSVFDLQINPYLFKFFFFFLDEMSSNEAETIYERVAKLEDEVASLRNELDILKNALKNKLARQLIKMIKKGDDVSSIFD